MRPVSFLLAILALCALAGVIPFSAGELSRVIPAELLVVSAADGGVLVQVDSGTAAWGADVPEALETLSRAAPGSLLLSTVDRLVFCGLLPEAEELLDCGLRPAAAVFLSPEPEDPEALRKYLRNVGGVTLGILADAPQTPLPRLIQGQSGLYLDEEWLS